MDPWMIFVQVILAEGKMDKKKSAWCTAVPWALWIACSVGVKWGLLVYPSLENFQEVSPAWTFHWDHHFPVIIPSLDSIFLEGGLALGGMPLDFHDILMVAMSYSVISTWAFSLTAVGPAELIQDSNVMSDESYWDALILILIEFGPVWSSCGEATENLGTPWVLKIYLYLQQPGTMETSTDVQLAKELSKNAAGQKTKSGQMDTLKSVARVTKLEDRCFTPPQEVLEFYMEAEVQNDFQVPF